MKNFSINGYKNQSIELKFIHNGLQMIYTFENGYQASVVQHDHSYGGDSHVWEIAVMYDGSLVYDTPITEDVLGWQTMTDVAQVLADISKLPERTEEEKNTSSFEQKQAIMDKW